MGHVGQLVKRYFGGDLSANESTRMRVHLRRCESCREMYDHTALLLRAAADRQPTGQEMDLWSERVVDQIMGSDDRPVLHPRRRMLLRVAPVLALGVALVVGVGLLNLGTDPQQPGRQNKGGLSGIAPMVDLEVFAIRTREDAPATPRLVPNRGTLRIEEFIQFRFQNHEASIKHLYLLGLDSRQSPLDYFPRPAQDQSIAISEALSMQSVGRSIRLSQRHQAGSLWIVALFSTEPLSRQRAHEIVSQMQSRGLSGESLDCMNIAPGVYPVVRQFLVLGGK